MSETTQRRAEEPSDHTERRRLVSTTALGAAFVTAIGAGAALAPPAMAGCRNNARCSSRYWYAYEPPDTGPTGPIHCQGLTNEAQNEDGGTAVVQPLFHSGGEYHTGKTTTRYYGAVAESSYSGWFGHVSVRRLCSRRPGTGRTPTEPYGRGTPAQARRCCPADQPSGPA
jgi:hypothetical protein